MQSNADETTSGTGSNAPTLGERRQFSSESKRQREGSKHRGAMGSRIGSSDLIFLEGILPEKDGEVLNDLSTEEQTELCFERLKSLLSARRVDLSTVMKFEVQMTTAAEKEAVDRVYQNQFEDQFPPRTEVGVCSLPGGADIQFDVIAAQE
ncbi:RidA family protein [Natronococcus wangiae]|uniref:RidA family protein n=1 Tax=Natronococcus wangiae TaxID=3068275 RepID=UPI00273EBC78|nr:RidA family protein [Natronococcus sp. AD5]